MERNCIEVGGLQLYQDRLSSSSCLLEASILGDDLPIDTLDFTISLDKRVQYLYSSDDSRLVSKDGCALMATDMPPNPASFHTGEPVRYLRDGALHGLFVLKSKKREGTQNYSVSCVSPIGTLEDTRHYGGIYTGQTVQWMLDDIIGGKVRYTVDAKAAADRVYGYLPIDTRRANLQQLLFAQGLAVRKNADGTPHFTYLSDAQRKQVPPSRVYDDTGDVEDNAQHATRALITEHAYFAYPSDTEKTLFEGIVASDPITTPQGAALYGTVIPFDAPMHDIVISGSTILESGVNYAVIGAGGNVKLTGREYTHTQRVLTVENPNKSRALTQVADKEARVTDPTLVSFANARNVAARELAYYGAVNRVQTEIVAEGERAGDAVGLTNSFGEYTEGFVESMEFAVSNLLRASVSIAAGYVPTGGGTLYTRVAVITQNSVWTAPEGVHFARAVLISGGQGGYSGQKGEDGERRGGAPGSGGDGGNGGSGGKILITEFAVSAGTQYAARIGQGGAGGVYSELQESQGVYGSPTTFAGYSSDAGSQSGIGYYDPMTATFYGASGTTGMRGGNGGQDGSLDSDDKPLNAANGESVYGLLGGAGGESFDKTITYPASSHKPDRHIFVAGGGGGGAAYGANGQGGTRGSIDEGKQIIANGGEGGAGANATSPEKAKALGSGGTGGAGGGGGGSGGHSEGADYDWKGEGGLGGRGSNGGAGADGCVLIYY